MTLYETMILRNYDTPWTTYIAEHLPHTMVDNNDDTQCNK